MNWKCGVWIGAAAYFAVAGAGGSEVAALLAAVCGWQARSEFTVRPKAALSHTRPTE